MVGRSADSDSGAARQARQARLDQAEEEVDDVDPVTGRPISDLMVSAARIGGRTDEFEADDADVEISDPDDVAPVETGTRPVPFVAGFHQIDFDDDEAIDELSKGIADVIATAAEELGIPVGDDGEMQVWSIGGVRIPKEHAHSNEAAYAWYEKHMEEQ